MMSTKRLCEDCRFVFVYNGSERCKVNGDGCCSRVNPRGLCEDFEPPPPRRSLMRRSPEAAGAAAVGLGAGVVELLHWIGGLL